MTKLILTIAAITFANQFQCISTENTIQQQLDECKTQILRSICEQENIKVWANSHTNNNILQADEINTSSTCNNINVKFTNITHTKNGILISFQQTSDAESVKVVTMNQWKDIKLGTIKTVGSLVEQKRPDSTQVTDINIRLKIDSQTIKKWKDKGNRILAILKENK